MHRKINGVLLLDKPLGFSSNQAVQRVKRILSAAKCGHTGTLDPMATGLLPLCLGEATKFSSTLLTANKTYETTLKLGYLSTTGDAEGEIRPLLTQIARPTLAHCEDVLSKFIGHIQQIPPMYSALKYQGKPLYAYARKGTEIDRPARTVHIHEIRVDALHADELKLSIRCGTGTYIRTLAEDIGKALGCGSAYLLELRRTAIDNFDISHAQTLASLNETAIDQLDRLVLPIDCLLQKYPAITLDDMNAQHLIQGRIIQPLLSDTLAASEHNTVRLYSHRQHLLGLGEIMPDRKIVAKRLLANSELFGTAI
ncbi:tRNA pseudouridine(55) synthase TruB [Nitrosomonas sp. JL21]|uniref:tRNA pseudouridine(55) synthase TruB n=1 Tax=Nitrosomonas sp. JL21 TaxID=153949 RepID=UPI0013709F76|nr:tRNA pseudouridine(55) synthase TruB [Nitrosomonas sp. JL21]MBL8498636.1 tRNA pseudouridine(55) synthase TruB [Nitrosomonas sp.]MCC7091501.1 tRNA pseudouridine(55) synthase TruB [Nitrosomonas sp.]MXS79049.1 tRNA pseudouridine(55) synthase TruB [Nitrosomonas sp. JL21]